MSKLETDELDAIAVELRCAYAQGVKGPRQVGSTPVATASAKGWLVVIGDRDALWWVLSTGRLAFPTTRMRRAYSEVATGDAMYLYTTRGCFHNPTRDRGRVVGKAKATSVIEELDEPYVLRDRSFPIGCEMRLTSLAPVRAGAELVPLRGKLKSIPAAPGAFAMSLRQPLVRLGPGDAIMLDRALNGVAGRPRDVVESYRR